MRDGYGEAIQTMIENSDQSPEAFRGMLRNVWIEHQMNDRWKRFWEQWIQLVEAIRVPRSIKYSKWMDKLKAVYLRGLKAVRKEVRGGLVPAGDPTPNRFRGVEEALRDLSQVLDQLLRGEYTEESLLFDELNPYQGIPIGELTPALVLQTLTQRAGWPTFVLEKDRAIFDNE